MKILCVCEQGNNRSVNFAQRLKYKYKADTISIGLATTSQETLKMLYDWADYIIIPEKILRLHIPEGYDNKIKYFEVGQDTYPRPFNIELDRKVRQLIEQNPL